MDASGEQINPQNGRIECKQLHGICANCQIEPGHGSIFRIKRFKRVRQFAREDTEVIRI